jgi:hypothetical protein
MTDLNTWGFLQKILQLIQLVSKLLSNDFGFIVQRLFLDGPIWKDERW